MELSKMQPLENFLPILPTLNTQFIEIYCDSYRSVFSNDRDFNAFKSLHSGMISNIPRKYLLDISKTIRTASYKSLLQLVNGLFWNVETLRKRRLELTQEILEQSSVKLVIEELGIPKKGKRTDYIARQYMSNLGRKENGLIVLIAYGVSKNAVFPLTFSIFKPKERLKGDESFKAKTQIAIDMAEDLKDKVNIEAVLIDGFYGENQSSCLTAFEDELRLDYVVAVSRSNRDWLRWGQVAWEGQSVELSDSNSRIFFVREGDFWKGVWRCWQISSTDTDGYPIDAQWSLITHVPDMDFTKALTFYLIREWISCTINPLSEQLGWSDFQMTNFAQIERWWEIVMSTHLMLTLHLVRA